MTHRTKRFLCAAGTAALLLPAAAGAKPGGDHSKARQHGKAGQHGHKGPKAHNAVFQGTLVSADATAGTAVVHVTKANKWGRSLVGQDVTFDLTHSRVHVRDVNHDGKRDLNDTAANDRVSVQAKLAQDSAQPFAARQFQDHGQPKPQPADGGDDTASTGGDDTTSTGGDTTSTGGDTTSTGGDTTSTGGDTTSTGGDTTSTGGDTTPSGDDSAPPAQS